MYLVPIARCNISDNNGTVYYFCCLTCKTVFVNNPFAYPEKEEGFNDSDNNNDYLNRTFRIL